MASFFQRFGKSSKEAKASKTSTSEENLDDDDLFSGLEILPTQQQTADHFNDLQDLDLHVTEKEESGNINASGFSFLHQGGNINASAFSFLHQVKPEQYSPALTLKPTNITSQAAVIARKTTKKNKKRTAKRPGTAGAHEVVTQLSCSSVSEKEDTASLSSADVDSVHSLEDLDTDGNVDNSNLGATTNDLTNPSIKSLNETCQHEGNKPTNQCAEEHKIDIHELSEVGTIPKKEICDQVEVGSTACTSDVHQIGDDQNESEFRVTNMCEGDNNDKNEIVSEDKNNQDNTSAETSVTDMIINQNESLVASDDIDILSDEVNQSLNRSYTLDLTVNQKLDLQIETLQSHQIESRNELEHLQTLQNQLISNWKSAHLTADEINEKKLRLFQQQTVLESREEYGAAADLEQQIQDLNEQLENFKFQHPILDEQFLNLLNDYNVKCKLHSGKKEELKKLCTDLLIQQKEKIATEKNDKEVNFDAMSLRLKEEKVTLERSMSHNQLDKEHLSKIAALLNVDIEKKTANLNNERRKLIEKKSSIQEEIEKLLKELKSLEAKSDNISVSIQHIDDEVRVIENEFQPKIEKIEGEKKLTEDEELRLKLQMETIALQEKSINEEKLLLQEEKERNRQRMKELEVFVNVTEVYEGIDVFSYQKCIDVHSMQRSVDENYSRLKEELLTRKTDLQNLSNKILEDQTNQSSLQRMVNTIETQLSDLQSLKQAVVKDRKYKEAERLSEEIKRLSKEGAEKQAMVEDLIERLKAHKEEKVQVESSVDVAKEQFSKIDFENDMKIAGNLKAVNQDIKEFMKSEPGSLIQNILQLQLGNNLNIIEALEKKHGVSISQEVDLATVEAELENLEKQLQKAEDTEDWTTAERINNEIIKKRKIYDLV